MKHTQTPSEPTSQPIAANQSTGLAVASLVLGILSLTGFGFILGIPAIITGVMALKRSQNDRGLSWTGIITGAVSTILSLLFILFVLLLILLAAFSAGSNPGYYEDLPDSIQPTESA